MDPCSKLPPRVSSAVHMQVQSGPGVLSTRRYLSLGCPFCPSPVIGPLRVILMVCGKPADPSVGSRKRHARSNPYLRAGLSQARTGYAGRSLHRHDSLDA